ncbi:AAA family ATPase [Leptolyngbya sp. NIES-2104]|uniref:AAA family ATPase n=1 Tax=Leptolyngbya sp. NIES-2104 TaxID=1552121 RepID=UPI0006ECAB78|nr:SMC family ATPase [Leptolyngbya sp. NIES-2104]GAP97503.1 exonuclease SbcC [Leptolyngbya sp. NIES-2104]
MEILSVSLTNFKFHRDRAFSFQPGTNAICGENGAGKTSILEAIAWVLFDYSGAYTKEDLIRNGANSAQVRVSFISSRDQRTYDINRCTRSSYTIYDPELGEKLSYTKKEDVLPWLREHLGVPAGTNLSQLFRNTIGVPQGTFTVDFLGTAEERKKVFDPILKVEEYKKVYKELGDLEKFAKAQSEKLERDIQQYDELLLEWDDLSQQKQTLSRTIQQIQTDLKQWEEQYDRLKSDQEKYTAIASQVLQLTTNLESISSRIRSEELNVERLKTELEAAEKSVKICTERRDSYQAYLQAEQALREFDQSRSQQEQLMRDRAKRANALGACESKIAVLAQKEERRSQLEADLKQLEPLIEQQSELEQKQKQLSEQLQTCQSWKQTLQRDEKRLAQLQASQRQLSDEIERLEGLGAIVKQIPQLEEQQQRYQQQLSRIEAATQFEADLRQIMLQAQKRGDIQTQQVQAATATLKELQATPIWQPRIEAVLTALENSSKFNRHLMQDLQGILDDLSQQTVVDRLKQSLKETQNQLKLYRDHEAQYRGLEAKFDQEEKLDAEVVELRSLIAEHQSQLIAEPELQAQLNKITEQLTGLENPRDRSRYLARDLKNLSSLETERALLQTEFDTAQAAITKIDSDLQAFENLAEQIQEQQNLRDRDRSDYQIYLEHQKSANSYKERKAQLEEAIAQLEHYQDQLKSFTNQKAQLEETYDPEEVKRINTDYQEANRQKISLSTTLPIEKQRLDECETRLAKLQVTQQNRSEAQTQLKQKQKTDRFIKFARKSYKEAAPRITERYVQTISYEADRLFRELINRPNVALQWTRDYEIVVQEEAHSRRFINLSGGEQMCAALAVRLALLKVLADINIAFFDEPTTNMDRPRRESLAEAIGNIKSFRQLFVISHDDTFEKVTENVILVERET